MTVYKLQELINSSFIENIHFFNILKYIVLKSNRAVEITLTWENNINIVYTFTSCGRWFCFWLTDSWNNTKILIVSFHHAVVVTANNFQVSCTVYSIKNGYIQWLMSFNNQTSRFAWRIYKKRNFISFQVKQHHYKG